MFEAGLGVDIGVDRTQLQTDIGQLRAQRGAIAELARPGKRHPVDAIDAGQQLQLPAEFVPLAVPARDKPVA